MDALALVDLDRPPASDHAFRRAVRDAAGTQRVLVGVATAPVAGARRALLEALSCSLLPPGAGPAPTTCAAVPDLDAAVTALTATVAAAPQAATVLVPLLRLTSALPVHEGLVAESLAYSMLLAGEEFAAWRAGRTAREAPSPAEPPVLLAREGDVLVVTVSRPERRNAYGLAVRDALLEALAVAAHDPSLQVLLRGAGPAFCSGGDLDEFGTAPGVVTAHAVRLERSAGLVLHALRDRVTVQVHGACVGAGVELPSFAGRVVAQDGTWFQLPELAMGLVPGAGGTVSLTRRIGRWRTAWMALSADRVDVPTAVEWGLVDEVAGA